MCSKYGGTAVVLDERSKLLGHAKKDKCVNDNCVWPYNSIAEYIAGGVCFPVHVGESLMC